MNISYILRISHFKMYQEIKNVFVLKKYSILARHKLSIFFLYTYLIDKKKRKNRIVIQAQLINYEDQKINFWNFYLPACTRIV